MQLQQQVGVLIQLIAVEQANMAVQIQYRKDTAANWTSSNPTLLSGEMGYETDTNRIKVGDGTTAWTSLAYLAVGGSVGSGFQNMVVQTSGSAASWSLPTTLQSPSAKWKVTIVGGGAQGGGTNITAGQVGGGGGSGGLVVVYLTFVAGQTTMTYTVGTAGSGAGTNATGTSGNNSSIVYNAVTYTANGGTGGTASGAGGAGGTASGGTLNIAGGTGDNGGTMAATSNYQGNGGNTPLGYGYGGRMPVTAAGATGNVGTGYGAGGSGGRNGTGTTARAGGAGTDGVVIIEY